MIKRLQNDFTAAAFAVNGSGLFVVSASFLVGAAAAILYLQRFGTALCGKVFPLAAFICTGIIVETIILGCSLIGETVLPVCAALFGALVCICSASVRLLGAEYVRLAVSFVILTPVFFVTASEGMVYSEFLGASVYAKQAPPGREKYVLYACIAFVISTGVFHAMCI